jgi:hypothetical protein
VCARVEADSGNAGPLAVRLFLQSYNGEDTLTPTAGPEVALAPGADHAFAWRVPDMGGQPIAQVGVEIRRAEGQAANGGTIYLDELTWDGAPDVAFVKPAAGGQMWRQAWVNGVDQYDRWYPETFRLIQNEGVGLLMTGTREWTDYAFAAEVTPHMATSCGIAARVQGMRRYVGLTLGQDAQGRKAVRLTAQVEDQSSGTSQPFEWELGQAHRLRLEVRGGRALGWVDGQGPVELALPDTLAGGGVAMLAEVGRAAFEGVTVRPLDGER